MYAGTAVLVLCLTATAIGQPCGRRRKPTFDCKRAPAIGVFFPHPADCTFLVVCIAGQDVAVSLCDEEEFGNVYDPKYSLGCPKKCARIQLSCLSSPPPPLFATTTTSSPFSKTSTLQNTQPLSFKPPNIPITKQPQYPPPYASVTTTTLSSTSQTDMLVNCKRGGMAAHPVDCKKALICPSAGALAIEFNICENVARDSSFPVGCPQKCAGWRPGVYSEDDLAV